MSAEEEKKDLTSTNLDPKLIVKDNVRESMSATKSERFQKWLEEVHDFGDSSSVVTDDLDSSTVYSSTVETESDSYNIENLTLNEASSLSTTIIIPEEGASINHNQIIQQILQGSNSVQTFDKVHIENSKNVHVGNITVVKYIVKNPPKQQNRDDNQGSSTSTSRIPNTYDVDEEETEEQLDPNLFNKNEVKNLLDTPTFVTRQQWLAQPPMAPPERLNHPVKLVVICHTASEMGLTQAENVFLVRNIQTFHVESRKWSDISYNFLIGGDGFVYDGRGWQNVGAHTQGYNRRSIGISFIGCFIQFLPPEKSLKACKMLIQMGIDNGYIDKDYKLVGHCQCLPIESPGKTLYQELKTWPHWGENEADPNKTQTTN